MREDSFNKKHLNTLCPQSGGDRSRQRRQFSVINQIPFIAPSQQLLNMDLGLKP